MQRGWTRQIVPCCVIIGVGFTKRSSISAGVDGCLFRLRGSSHGLLELGLLVSGQAHLDGRVLLSYIRCSRSSIIPLRPQKSLAVAPFSSLLIPRIVKPHQVLEAPCYAAEHSVFPCSKNQSSDHDDDHDDDKNKTNHKLPPCYPCSSAL